MTVRILHGDSQQLLRDLAADSVDSCVTDPPYELGFMGKKWDGTGIAYDPAFWAEVLRVLKPGAHLLAFGGTRTHHRVWCAIEDAGFEVRDTLGWLYGSGFPKSHNGEWGGTALKPAWEPIILARKPLVGTVEANWREHGTGALNIDDCRIELNGDYKCKANGRPSQTGLPDNYDAEKANCADSVGRWPANIIHDGSEEVLAVFPDKAGAQAPVTKRNADKFRSTYGAFKGDIDEQGSTFHGDAGSAARFFYCAKPSRAERDIGMREFPSRNTSKLDPASAMARDGTRVDLGKNHHPTVKPVDLMRYLCRLVTPKGGTVLDTFLGSGTTARACIAEGFDCIGMEREAEYVEIAKARCHGDAPLLAGVAA